MPDIVEFMRGGGPCAEISRKCRTMGAGCACAMAANEIERLRMTVMELCVRNGRLGDILTEAVMDHSSARHMQFDWIDAAREAIGRKPA